MTTPDATDLNLPLESRFVALNAAIDSAAAAAGRDPGTITLIGASKTQPAETLRAAHGLGLRDFGENYLDEALAKRSALADLDATWHYIGRIQSNKTRRIAEHFDWVHTVDREKIARRLSEQCPADKKLNVLLQVNVDRDPAKAGVLPEAAEALALAVHELQNLRLRGLMTILSRAQDPAVGYRSMAQLSRTIGASLPDTAFWGVLSMGMSGDLPAAIHAGATHVRVGTALFGPRPAAPEPSAPVSR